MSSRCWNGVECVNGSSRRGGDQPILRAGKNGGGGGQQILECSLGDEPTPVDRQSTKLCFHPFFIVPYTNLCLAHPLNNLLPVGGLGDPPSLSSLSVSLVRHVTWKRILFSVLITQGLGSVYSFWDRNQKALEVHTIFGLENTIIGTVNPRP